MEKNVNGQNFYKNFILVEGIINLNAIKNELSELKNSINIDIGKSSVKN